MTRWKVGLSNGKSFTEGIEPFGFIRGELSPWLKLKKYINDNNLKIKSLAIISSYNQTFNLPSSGNNPKFSAFYNSKKPIRFDFHRAYGMDNNGKNCDIFSRATAIYEKFEVQLWVDHKNPKNSWVLVKDNSARI